MSARLAESYCCKFLFIGAKLISKTEDESDKDECRNEIRNTLKNGNAIAKFCAMMKFQGVEPQIADRLCTKGVDATELTNWPKVKNCTEMKIACSGIYFQRLP